MKTHTLLLLLATLSLLGCLTPSPKNQLVTDYVPPTSSEGRECVKECKKIQARCEHRIYEDARKDYEEARAQCITGEAIEVGCLISEKTKEPTLRNDTPACLEKYHECFETCGGSVSEEVRCVENCDGKTTQ